MVARWAHNPKVVRSSRASATKERLFQKEAAFFVAKSAVFICQNIRYVYCLRSIQPDSQ